MNTAVYDCTAVVLTIPGRRRVVSLYCSTCKPPVCQPGKETKQMRYLTRVDFLTDLSRLNGLVPNLWMGHTCGGIRMNIVLNLFVAPHDGVEFIFRLWVGCKTQQHRRSVVLLPQLAVRGITLGM